MRSALRSFVFAWALGVAASASANGRMPGANDLLVAPQNPDHLLLRATFGLVQSFDRGRSFRVVCEEAIGAAGVIADPPITITADESLVLLPPTGGALVSRDAGCSWIEVGEPLARTRGVDLTRDPSDARRALVLTSTATDVDARGFLVVRNTVVETRDDARSFQLLATLPSDVEAETIEVAASDPRRMYVSGTATDNPLLGVLFASSDGGATWTRSTLALPAGSGSLFVSAVHPRDPARLWVRVPARGDVLGILPARLYSSRNGGQSFEQLAATTRAMFGFALSPDGEALAYGGPADGLYIGASDGSAGFVKVSEVGVRCLRWTRDGILYACGTEPNDAFSLGMMPAMRSGALTPLYRLGETCPAECPETSPQAVACESAWPLLAQRLNASGERCGAPSNALDASVAPLEGDASSVSVPADASARYDAGAVTRGEDHGCALGTSRRDITFMMSLLLGWLTLRRRAFAALLNVVVFIGCADESNGGEHDHSDAQAVYEGCPATTPPFAIGMETMGKAGRVRARLVAASPVPPARYRNDWVVQLLSPDGSQLRDASIVRARPFMPVHGHDGNVQPTVRASNDDFSIDYLNLNMRGPWEVQLAVRSLSLGDDELVFHVCVPE